ncbi:hypothetical protein ScPMuIL_016344 [Solemya velum]
MISVGGKTSIILYILISSVLRCGYCINNFRNLRLSLEPDSSIQAIQGQCLTVRCVSNIPVPASSLSWRALADGKNLHGPLTTRKIDNRVSELHIKKVDKSDAGKYRCFFNNSDVYINVTLTIWVHSKESGAYCDHTQFRCSEQSYCIFSLYRCDGYEDCPDKSDEQDCNGDPCAGKVRCKSGRCVSKEHKCDARDCGDLSKKSCQTTIPTTGIISVVSEEPATDNADDMTWLKTTVYSVIGCAVGVVLFISVVVIFFFRLKMRKAERQRAMRALVRLRQVNQVSNPTTNCGASENEPFIHTAAGNIFVNVNNGVQYVPGIELEMGLVSPPSYSDAVQESRHQQGSPPPPYSTFDRNMSMSPSRTAEISTSTSNLELNRMAMCEQSPVAFQVQDTDACGMIDLDNQNIDSSVQYTQLSDTGNQSIGCGPSNYVSNRDENAHLTSDNEPNTSLHKHKQSKIEVRDGQIVLASDEAPSTSSCDISDSTVTISDDGAKAASQLVVRDGQIILTIPESLSAEGGKTENTNTCNSNRDSFGQANRGQLEVKDGKLVFKEGI